MTDQAPENNIEASEDTPGAQNALERKIHDFTDTFGSTPDVWLNIYELLSDGNKTTFLKTVAIDDVSPTQIVNMINDEYGPGMYQIAGRRNNEKGREMLVFRENIQIGRAAKGYKPPGAEKERGNGADDSAIAQALQLNNRLLERLLEKDTAPAAQPNMLDLMKDFAEIKKLFEPPPAAGNMLELVKDVLALKDQLLGSEEPRDALSMAMEKFLPAITNAVGKMQDHDQAGAQRGLVRTVGDAPTSMPPPLLKMLGQFLPTAIMAASMNVEPEKAAGIVIAQIATNLPLRHALAEFLDDDLAVDKVARINSGVLQHRDWFNDFIDHLVLVLIPDDPRAMAQAQTDFQQHLEETAHENKDLEKAGLDPDDKRASDDADSAEIGSEGAADDATGSGDPPPGDDP